MLALVILSIFFSLDLLFIAIALRSNHVFNIRRDMISRISELNLQDIRLGQPYSRWRWDLFDKVSFDRQVWTFWRDPESLLDPKMFNEIYGVTKEAQEEL